MPKVRINGWMRIWVVLTAIWGIGCLSVGTVLVKDSPSPERLRQDSSESGCNRVVNGEYVRLLDSYTKLQIITANASGSGNSAEARLAIQKCAEALTRDYGAESDRRRSEYIYGAIIFFALPTLLLLALGSAVAWIRRGFKQQP